MTTESINLELEPRIVLGKKVKQLRREGTIPVHLYGPGVEPRPLQCENRQLLRVLARAGSTNPVTLSIKGGGRVNAWLSPGKFSGVPFAANCCTWTSWRCRPPTRLLPRFP